MSEMLEKGTGDQNKPKNNTKQNKKTLECCPHCHEQFMIHLHFDTFWKAYVMSPFVIFRNQFLAFHFMSTNTGLMGFRVYSHYLGTKIKMLVPSLSRECCDLMYVNHLAWCLASVIGS